MFLDRDFPDEDTRVLFHIKSTSSRREFMSGVVGKASYEMANKLYMELPQVFRASYELLSFAKPDCHKNF